MIQDIFPHVYDNQYKRLLPSEDSTVIIFSDGQVLAKKTADKTLEYPKVKELGNLQEDGLRYLFSIDEEPYFLYNKAYAMDSALEAEANFIWTSTQDFREAEPLKECFAGITAYQLFRWYEDNKFCGKCGAKLVHGEKERHLHCPKCNNTIYPKISPAVIVGVIWGDKLLLTKYSGRAYKRYALIAGFAEVGESIEDTVRREVMEEVGLKVKNIRFYKSQPWSFTDTLLMGFYCDLDGDDTIRLDTEELSVGEWINRDEIPETSGRISLTGEMITRFKEGLE